MSKPYKVALVYDAVYPYIKGGGERRFYEIGRRLQKRGVEVHMYGMKLWEGPDIIEREGMYLHGIMKARPLYNEVGKRTLSQAVLFGFACWKMAFADVDAIDCCGFPYFSLFPIAVIAFLRRKPLYATWHEVWGIPYWRQYMGAKGIIGAVVEWCAARLPKQIIATSTYTADRLRSELHCRRPIVVVPNGIDETMIAPVLSSTEKTDLIYAGRLMDFKHVELIIEAMVILKERGKEVSCAIVGDGPEKKSLQQLAAKRKLTKQITWYGFLPDEKDVYAHMKAARVFILPSEREGFGIVAVEANACGTPVLTANFPHNAARYLIKDRSNGWIFEPTAVALADSIEHALSAPEVIRKTAKKAAAAYDWATIADRIKEVYTA